MSELDDNVIGFRDARPSVEVKEKSIKQKHGCAHRNLTLLVDRRMVECKDCDLVMDGFEWLLMYHKKEVRLRSDVKHLIKDKARLVDEVQDLERRKRNLKASVRRYQAK
ncbi:hypothetical protein [Vibrio europaeus]|uniref:hypothetical protein n=1 Tax=Vibrio europaeus TaxID=300876 RepID=UPI00233F0C25|nr:hypothetical protein [Vibrio europaeus]MDC5753586.1 hypothetical protein [Vibrio europaeus]MDC5816501.1 hypothetical protein [Vibrio europaeus]